MADSLAGLSRYRALRDMAGCGPLTAGFIALLNWACGVPAGTCVLGPVQFDYPVKEVRHG